MKKGDIAGTELRAADVFVTVPEEKPTSEQHSSLETMGVVAESMERDTKKVCCAISEGTRKTCHCCVRTWSLCLNGCECCCGGLSVCCIGMSNIALAVKACFEQMDCDGN